MLDIILIKTMISYLKYFEFEYLQFTAHVVDLGRKLVDLYRDLWQWYKIGINQNVFIELY